MKSISVYSWKPAVSSNFGDVIGPMIVQKMGEHSSEPFLVKGVTSGPGKMLCVGSILQAAEREDVVWGSGVNGKSWLPARIGKLDIKVFGVRGPISRAALLSVGVDTPEVYGDPGLLFPTLYHDEIMAAARHVKRYYEIARGGFPETVFVPNLNDERFYLPEAGKIPPEWEIINTGSSPVVVAAQIMLAKRVVSSSLHGLVFGDYYGKECVFFESRFEPRLKYDDYYLGTGRDAVVPVSELRDDLVSNVPSYSHDMGPMVAAFPWNFAQEEVVEEVTAAPLLCKEHAIQESPTAISFALSAVRDHEGLIDPNNVECPDYLWSEKVCALLIDRDMAQNIKVLTFFFSKMAPTVRPEKIRASVDGRRSDSEFVERNGRTFLRVDMTNQSSNPNKPCGVKINFGQDSDPNTAFGSKRLKDLRFSVQIRKIGAGLNDFNPTSS